MHDVTCRYIDCPSIICMSICERPLRRRPGRNERKKLRGMSRRGKAIRPDAHTALTVTPGRVLTFNASPGTSTQRVRKMTR